VEPSGTAPTAENASIAVAGVTTPTDPIQSKAPDEIGPPELPAALAEKTPDLIPKSGPEQAGQPDATTQDKVFGGQQLPLAREGTTFAPSAPGVTEGDAESLAGADASRAQVAGGLRTTETDGDATDHLWRIEAASTAARALENQSDAAAEDFGRDPRGSDRDTRSDGVDSLTTNHPLATDPTTGPVAHTRNRSDSAPGATVAEQIFGEIATRVELSHRDGRIDFRLQLDPPGMGTVHVRLTATDYSVSAQLIAEDPAARQAIEEHLHTLRESLAGMGVSLEQFGAARDDGSSRGAWQWQQPAPPSATIGFSVPKSAKRQRSQSSRPTTGVIDVVV
jgi:flagellar hook-length control protein FliK